MKVNRCFYLLLPSLLICFIRADCVSIVAQTDPPVQTDKKIYSVTLTPESFQVVIKWTYTNRTSATVYQTKVPIPMALEKKVGDAWVVALGMFPIISGEEFIGINPGGKFGGTWRIKGSYLGSSRNGGRRFELKEVPGAYRIVLGLYSTEDGDISGEMLPQEERVSNEFELVEKE